MRVAFPSLRRLTDDDAVLLGAMIGAAAENQHVLGRARLASFLGALRGTLRAAPRPTRPTLDSLPDLDDEDLEFLSDEARRLGAAHAAQGWPERAGFFADLRQAVEGERERRGTVLESVDAAMTWYDRHLSGRGS
jgi:hypothetical protein